ncbi:MAG: hypothetical protein OEV44_05310 [Spirochaetota bacterium]|nr:hypothetical protein [Spirochaetota bacterium]
MSRRDFIKNTSKTASAKPCVIKDFRTYKTLYHTSTGDGNYQIFDAELL